MNFAASSNASAYRRRAAELRDHAITLSATASTPTIHIELLAEAEKWDRLADAVERASGSEQHSS